MINTDEIKNAGKYQVENNPLLLGGKISIRSLIESRGGDIFDTICLTL